MVGLLFRTCEVKPNLELASVQILWRIVSTWHATVPRDRRYTTRTAPSTVHPISEEIMTSVETAGATRVAPAKPTSTSKASVLEAS